MAYDPTRYYTLDAMRGIASIAVVISHLAFRSGLSSNLSANAHLAVDFFFVLSGFVIARAYEDKLLHDLIFSEFAKIRIIRLYPLIFLGCAIGLTKQLGQIVAHSHAALTGTQLLLTSVANFIVLPTPIISLYSAFPLNDPEWSLFDEITVNLIYAGSLVRLKNPTLIFFIVFPAFAVILTGVMANGTLDIGWNWHTFEFGIARVVFSFPIGVVAARLISPSRRVESKWALAPILLLVFLLMIPVSGAQRVLDLVLLILTPLLVVAGALLEIPEFLKALSKFLGDISYPLYAIHFPLIGISLFAQERYMHFPFLIYIVLYGSCLIAFAVLAAKYYDGPVRRSLSSVLRTRGSALPQVL